MPSSRASSPLSSATPSPNTASTPLPRNATTGSFGYQSGNDSDRDDRSGTSSTAVLDLSDESDLTDDEEDRVEQPIVPVKRENVDLPEQPDGEDEEDGEEVEEEEGIEHGEVEDLDMDDEKIVVPTRSGQRKSSRESSTSLSPPPSVPLKPTDLPAFGLQRDGQEDEKDEEDADEANDADADADDDEEPAKQRGDRESENEEDETMEDGPIGDEPDPASSKLSPKAPKHTGATDDDAEGGDAEDGEDKDDPSGEDAAEQSATAEPVEEPVEEVTDEQEEAEADVEAADIAVPQQPTRSYHSSHAPPPTAAHVRDLLHSELKFAALRDQLYVERMEEVAAEEQMILDGTHPALQYLYKTSAERRERLHEVASRRHQETKAELKRARESDKNHTWSWWTDERDRSHWEEFDSTWSKRRRLAREKNEIETPRIVKPVPRAGGKIRNFDWSAGAAPSRMSMDEASSDLAMMENRPLLPAHVTHMSRHASPVVYAPAPAVPQPVQQHAATVAGPSNTNGIATARPPAAGMAPQQSSFTYGGAGPSAYNIPRQTHTAQPVGTAAAAPAANRPPAQARPQGRTVPTTSDSFESGRKDAAAAAMPWAKTEHNRNANGHGHPSQDAATASPVAPSKAEDRPPSRFPGLSEYMNSANSKAMPGTGATGAGGYGGSLSAGNKMLSPPKTTTASVLSTFAGRPGGPFTATQSANPTPAGTTAARP